MSEPFEEESEDVSMDGIDGALPLCPPPLRHQRSSDLRFEDSPPVYRSLSAAQHGSSSSMFEDPYDDDEVVFRSIPRMSSVGVLDHAMEDDYGSHGYPSYSGWRAGEVGSSTEIYEEGPTYRGGKARVNLPALLSTARIDESSSVTLPPAGFVFELPPELLDLVLAMLDPCPDLFAAMLCSRSWRDAAHFNYLGRRATVPALPDALLRAVDCAQPGDTLAVAAGIHMLSTEIAVDKPLRFIPGAGGIAVLASTHHVLLRTRCSALVEGLTLLRLGDEVGYPNAVVYAEAGALIMRDCRITCGGAAPSAEQAVQVFDGVPAAGAPWPGAERPSVVINNEAAAPADTAQDPQSGLWVGAAAHVELSSSMILCCQGPGIKIYRGELRAEGNTIAFASRGANVVANGGRVKMLHNEIKGALGDGVSSWNNSHLSLDTNRIHANSGAGIAINTGGGAVNITKNLVFDNNICGCLFATSQTKQANLSENVYERNAQGDVQGLHQVAGHRFLHQQRRRSGAQLPLQRESFAPPPIMSQAADSDEAGPSTFPSSENSMEM